MKIIGLLGTMGTGKTTIYNELIKNGFVGIKETTTRPIRLGERSNQYMFVINEEFDENLNNGLIIGTSSFVVSNGDCYRYGFHLNSLPIDIENDCVVQVNYQNVQALKEFYGDDFICIKLVRDKEQIINSVTKRGDNIDEIKRRLDNDISIYLKTQSDYTFNNMSIEQCISLINKIRG